MPFIISFGGKIFSALTLEDFGVSLFMDFKDLWGAKPFPTNITLMSLFVRFHVFPQEQYAWKVFGTAFVGTAAFVTSLGVVPFVLLSFKHFVAICTLDCSFVSAINFLPFQLSFIFPVLLKR